MSRRLLPLALTSWLLLGAAAQAETVCIVAPEGGGWRCGSAEEMAALQPGRAQRRDEAPVVPPPLLIDPSRLPRLQYDAAAATGFANASQPVASQPAAATPPATTATSAPGPEDAWLVPSREPTSTPAGNAPATQAVATATPQASARSAPAKAAVAPRPTHADSAGASTTAAESAAATEAATASPAAVPPAATPATPMSPPSGAAATAAAIPEPPAPPVAARAALEHLQRPTALGDRGDEEYTLQLVAARSNAGFAAFAQRHGLDPSTLYSVRLRLPEGDWWLLCSGRHANLAQARAALAELPAAAREQGAWPRRIGPLKRDAG